MAALGPCQATVLALSNVLGGNSPRVDNAGTIYALLDAQNRVAGEAPDPTSGRHDGFVTRDTDGDNAPIVMVRHYQRNTEDTRTIASCVGNPKAITKKQFKITMYRETSVRVTWKEMTALCGDAAKVFTSGLADDGSRYKLQNTPVMKDVHEQVNAAVYKLVADINKDLNTKLGVKSGRNRRKNTTGVVNYEMWNADGTKRSRGYNEMITDYSYHGFGGTPIVIGGAEMQMYANEMRWGNLAATGTDYAKMASADPIRFYLDKDADTNLGQDNFLVLAPGLAKLVTYNMYGGLFSGQWGTGDFGSFTMPEFGTDLRFDLHIEQISCPEPHADIMISLHYDVFVPEDIFKAYDATVGATNDPNYGVNGLFKGKVAYRA